MIKSVSVELEPTKDELQDQLGFLFIHAPKTAGRSIVSALGCKPNISHTKLIDYEKRLGLDELRRRIKYGCVRNPWDRAVSWYLFFYIGMGIYRGIMKSDAKFSEWVVEMAGIKTYWGNPLDNLSYFRNSYGEVMIDNFIEFETLDTDYAKLVGSMEILGKMDMPAKMPEIGVGIEPMLQRKIDAGFVPPANYRELYDTQESIDVVAGLNQQLIKQFGYQF